MDHILSAGNSKLFHSQVKQIAFKINGLEQFDYSDTEFCSGIVETRSQVRGRN